MYRNTVYALPPGYALEELVSHPEIDGPLVLVLVRPDGWPVATFAPAGDPEAIERRAWRDHRRRTLRLVAGGKG